ncbi:ABC transporter permease [Brachybacterium sp. EF45031]|uniref:ABC transporter permease n=1 Tax=Brachybacterium sillae TaxID=2810536 RepID=UPI00217DE0C3|nr:ABC transporter permease [Brachybacterium sillae]MCS6711066.1 ABC transporter permease [Brachybacterium sillae]
MSTAPTLDLATDEVVEKKVTGGRLRTWWRLPAALTALGLLALTVFGLLARSGQQTGYRIVQEGGWDLGVLPASISLPARATAIVLSLLALAIAAAVWALQARRGTPPRRLRAALVVVFGVLWVLAFLTWAVAGAALDLASLLQVTMILAVPLAFGALSGVLSERAGVVNIAIEGQLLFGAFGAALIGSLTHSVWLGLLAAPLMALIMGALLALFAIGHQVQQIIVGVVLNVLAVGLTSFFFGTVMKQNPQLFNTPMRLPVIRIPGLADLPLIGRVLFEQNILVYLMWIIVAVLTVALFRTRWGLRVRAVGEHPRAADTMGIAVNRTRWKNVLLGAAVAGLGGAILTLGTGVAFADNMSAGKGYIALAAMILGRYHPVGALAAALTFAFADALQLRLGTLPQGTIGGAIPSEFLLMIPYVVTLFAVAGVVGRVRVPAADGIPYTTQ